MNLFEVRTLQISRSCDSFFNNFGNTSSKSWPRRTYTGAASACRITLMARSLRRCKFTYERVFSGAQSNDVIDCEPNVVVAGLPSEYIFSETLDDQSRLPKSSPLAAMKNSLLNAKRQEKQFGDALVANKKKVLK